MISSELQICLASGLLLSGLGALSATEAALSQLGVHKVRRTLEAQQRNGKASSEKTDEVKLGTVQSNLLQSILIGRVLILLMCGCLLVVQTQLLSTTNHQMLAAGAGVFILLFVEVLSRQLGTLNSQRVAGWAHPIGSVLSNLFYPAIWLLRALTKPFLPRSAPELNPLVTNFEEIHAELLQLQLQGVLEQEETKIIQSVFAFGETIAKEVMVPRVDMICVELGAPLGQVLDLMITSGFTRLPVYDDDVDNILGLVHAKDLLRKLEKHETQSIKKMPIDKSDLREILVVPGTKRISKILRQLQQDKVTMAVVADEYGGTDGILTLEDIVEEIVGEITDEYDQAHEGVQIARDGSSIVDAKTIIEDVNEILNLDLPHDEHETLGGYVYGLFGRVPKTGESMEVNGLKLTVESTHRQRITRVRIRTTEGASSREDLPVAASA
jgi:putative hemolysin